MEASNSRSPEMIFAKSEKKLQKTVNEFNKICSRRKLKVNEGNSKVMVFERKYMM